jgi:hypothetical protein
MGDTTGRRGDTKRQHYVPRFVLRNFSKNETQIPLLHLASGKRVPDASIGRQCYGDYFYGEDNIMEKSFSESEAKWSAFFGDLDPCRFEQLTKDDINQIRLFMMYQNARTLGAAEHVNGMHSSVAKMALKGKLALDPSAKFSAEDVESLRVEVPDAPNESIWQAVKSLPGFIDLNAKLVYTDRTPGFVLSDNPVVMYNQFVEKDPYLRHFPVHHGLMAKGLQLFMPLSPSMTLALFDPEIYDYGGKRTVCKAGPEDVKSLNRMQAVSGVSCFYFHEDRITDESLKDLCAVRAAHPSIYKQKVDPVVREDGIQNPTFVTYRPSIRVGASLSFVKIKDGHSYARYEGAAPPVRSHELQQLGKDYGEALEQHVKEMREQIATGQAKTP